MIYEVLCWRHKQMNEMTFFDSSYSYLLVTNKIKGGPTYLMLVRDPPPYHGPFVVHDSDNLDMVTDVHT